MANYEVGYRKPPKHAQFKKGQSGNPKGRPKKVTPLNLATVVANTLRQTVELVDEKTNKKITITKLEATIQRLVDNAVKGDHHAFRALSALTHLLDDPQNAPTMAELQEADKKVMEMLARQFASMGAEQP
jgi:hypothetical protein